eukprot:TRINITY_DN41608_c0_g1_i1.p1 TRINITY_DN41608_c0_g1~~TRINITY_DN41608_c0_g1_i1.p1  ORF type:complete len:523 (-),score=98.51 TRINITY_DN41608_c0_g1_i1:172-1671(-)
MACSEVYKQAAGKWSPNSRYLAAASQNRVLVREGDTLKLVRVFLCVDKVERIEWADDSVHLLSEASRQGVVHIWNLNDGDWQCRIDESLGGVARARWSPSCRHVVIVSEFQLYLSVWDLEKERSVAEVKHPKHPQRGIAFSESGQFLAVVKRHDCKDSLVVLEAGQGAVGRQAFEQLADVRVEGDIADLAWAPGEAAIVVWERPAKSPRLSWYSTSGDLLGRLADCGLMRRVVPSTRSARHLAVATFDGCVHLVNAATMKHMTRWQHDLKIACSEAAEAEVQILREEEEKGEVGYAVVPSVAGAANYLRLPVAGSENGMPSPGLEAPLDADGLPRQGIGAASWSTDERYLATRHDAYPSVVWIWDVARLCLATVLLHRAPVRSFAWSPLVQIAGRLRPPPRLAVATAEMRLGIWTAPAVEEAARLGGDAAAASVVIAPCPMSAATVRWRDDGQAVLIQDREKACVFWPSAAPASRPWGTPKMRGGYAAAAAVAPLHAGA